MAKLTKKELVAHLLQLVERSSDQKQLATDVAEYLVAERQVGQLDAILRELEHLRFAKDGVLEATAASAFPLSTTTKKAITALFDAKKVIIHEQHNSDLVGGVQVRAMDNLADFSVQARLRQLRNSL